MDVITLALTKKYTDGQRLAYVEYGEPVTVIQGSYEFKTGFVQTQALAPLNVGEFVTLIIDGVKYEGTAKRATINTTEIIYIGNGVNNRLPDTKEEFFVGTVQTSTSIIVIVELINEGEIESITHNISVSTASQTIHTIDQKYLPNGVGGGLPTIEFITPIQMSEFYSADMLEEDCKKLDELFAKDSLFIGKWNDDNGISLSVLFTGKMLMAQGDSLNRLYVGTMNSTSFQIMDLGKGWQLLMQ